ncbi:MAG: RNA polymerase sigma factor, partial [Microbacterium sp.]
MTKLLKADRPPTALDLLGMVDRWHAYVQARVRQSDVDDVLQSACETVWRRRDDYNPSHGDPGAFVFGVVRMTVLAAQRRYGLDAQRSSAWPDEPVMTASTAPDPLDWLIEHKDAIEWVRFVADAVTTFEWSVFVELVRNEDGTSFDIAEKLHTHASWVRTVRGRIATLVRAARIGIALRDAGSEVTGSACTPPEDDLIRVRAMGRASVSEVTDALGLAPTTVRSRRSLLRRIDALADEIAASR